MSRYRKIDVRTWGDAKFMELSVPTPCGQFLWLYLLTGPHTTSIPGVSVIGEAALAEALHWPLEALREAFQEVFAKGMAKADWEHRVLYVPNAIKYNQPESANVIKSWRPTWDEVPECELKLEAYDGLRHELMDGKGFLEAFDKALPKPFAKASRKASANQEQEQEHENNKGQHSLAKPCSVKKAKCQAEIPCDFISFWDAYPNRVKKLRALECWNARIREGVKMPDPLVSRPLEYRPTLTAAGQRTTMLNLGDTDDNRQIWESLPGFYWQFPVTKLRAGASALVVNPQSRGQPEMPLLVVQNYGQGRLLFLGSDETWRWRSNAEDRYFSRFWSQVVSEMGTEHLLGDSARRAALPVELPPDRPFLHANLAEEVLRGAAGRSGGEFYREEDLHDLSQEGGNGAEIRAKMKSDVSSMAAKLGVAAESDYFAE